MVYFDKRNLRILKTIYRHKNGIKFETISRNELHQRNSDEEKEQLAASIIGLFNEGYIGCSNTDKAWIRLTDPVVGVAPAAIFFCTEKGNEFLEKRSYGFWKWMIPTIISVLALVVSFLGAIY